MHTDAYRIFRGPSGLHNKMNERLLQFGEIASNQKIQRKTKLNRLLVTEDELPDALILKCRKSWRVMRNIQVDHSPFRV
ncbi:hypothetical protein SprV_0200609000 [Sparganum proliferum]